MSLGDVPSSGGSLRLVFPAGTAARLLEIFRDDDVSEGDTSRRLPPEDGTSPRSLSRWLLPLCAAVPLAFLWPLAARAADPPPKWDTFSDTWVATDALGRALPAAETVGPPRANKTVGMFYFLTFDHTNEGPYDNTKILAAHPEALTDVHNPAWGPLNSAHYWGEPLFGYYVSDDEYVLRKHAQMLSDAGVDVVFFDNSNAVTYDRARNKLMDVWERIRREGGRTPQIAFWCPFGNSNGIGTSTMRELYETIYEPNRYPDLWFRLDGKPLIIADPSYADAGAIKSETHTPTSLDSSGTLGQTFTADRPFDAIGGSFPTWGTTGSSMTLTLYAGDKPGGKRIASHRFENIADNAADPLELAASCPAGHYYLELSMPDGHVGWWGATADVYSGGQAFESGEPTAGDRALSIRYPGGALTPIAPDIPPMTAEAKAALAKTLRDFFTFRSPIGPYNIPNPPPNHWAWLQIYPQAPQRASDKAVEEISVGVAQNYNATVNKTAPMSVDGAFGRSYHEGKLDTRPGVVNWGFNFDEQWKRALDIDPPFVFITGWNEWTAGFYDNWAGFKAPPAIFVDEFTHEFSRDIEPMRGGHGDDYYYQLAANVRRYKGVRSVPPVMRQSITIDGNFGRWAAVQPEFRDDIGDTGHRNAPASGRLPAYVNNTGRNDIVAAKICYDARNVYFYVRARDPLTVPAGNNYMLLFLNTDTDYKTGWLGYDFIVNRIAPKGNRAFVQHCIGGSAFAWGPPVAVPCRIVASEMELAIPRSVLGIGAGAATIDFKWADNCLSESPTWSDFTLNGDAAPNDRFNYRAKIGAGHGSK